jgi:hypothetical protein
MTRRTACEGGAAAGVLQRFFGTDHISFSACSLSLPLVQEQCGGASEVLRRYKSFSQAAEENGESRILIGIHFRQGSRRESSMDVRSPTVRSIDSWPVKK